MKKLLLVFALFGTQWYNKIKSQTTQRIVISTNKCDVIKITTSQNEQCTFKDTNLFFCSIQPNEKITVKYKNNNEQEQSKDFTLAENKTKFDLKCENNQITIE